MKTIKRILTVLFAVLAILTAIFLAGRFGWKLRGFNACQSAGLRSVNVTDNTVYISGYYPGSFPQGFCGYYAEEHDGTLYVGFRFDGVFGFFETGNFDIAIPISERIKEVVVKTRKNEYAVWNSEHGVLFNAEQYGVYVKSERNDVFGITMSCDYFSGGTCNADNTAIETGEYLYMDNDIMLSAKEANTPIAFTVTAVNADGSPIASEEFFFDTMTEKMYLTVTSDGKIVKD